MKLNLKERLLLLQTLPQQGNILTLKIIRDMQSKIALTADELEECGVVNDEATGQIKWKSDKEIEIEFGIKETDIIAEALESLNKSKQLTIDHLALCEKFLEEG